jgi:hypothetical protein
VHGFGRNGLRILSGGSPSFDGSKLAVCMPQAFENCGPEGTLRLRAQCSYLPVQTWEIHESTLVAIVNSNRIGPFGVLREAVGVTQCRARGQEEHERRRQGDRGFDKERKMRKNVAHVIRFV